MIKPKTLSRLAIVKQRIEKVRRAELAEASIDRDRALDAQRDIAGVKESLRNPLVASGVRSGREHEELAALLARAREDFEQAAVILRDRETECEVRRAAVADAAREARNLERASDRAALLANRDQNVREQNNADDRAAQRARAE